MATGMAPSTIGRGLRELAQDEPSERIRRPGAGRKRRFARTRRYSQIRGVGRTNDTRGSGIAVAVALQERAPAAQALQRRATK